MRVAMLGALLLLACHKGTTAPAIPAPSAVMPADAGPATVRQDGGPAAQAPATGAKCESPAALTAEVERLLRAAAAHSTQSRSCADGRGERVNIDEIRVCAEKPTDGEWNVTVSYRVGTFPEGDTRGCPPPCEWTRPRFTSQRTRLTFVPAAAAGSKALRVRLPPALPGLEGMTPLDKTHDGECYGKARPFVPAAVEP